MKKHKLSKLCRECLDNEDWLDIVCGLQDWFNAHPQESAQEESKIISHLYDVIEILKETNAENFPARNTLDDRDCDRYHMRVDDECAMKR